MMPPSFVWAQTNSWKLLKNALNVAELESYLGRSEIKSPPFGRLLLPAFGVRFRLNLGRWVHVKGCRLIIHCTDVFNFCGQLFQVRDQGRL